jgi:hypothetical protein
MKKNVRRYIIFLGVIAAAFLISAARMYFEDYGNLNNPVCGIEHGYGKCVEGYFRIPFYNPNRLDITSIKITVPAGIQTNITLPADFVVNEPLSSGKTGVMMLFPCSSDSDMGDFSMVWCCGNACYTSSMKWLNPEVKIANQ